MRPPTLENLTNLTDENPSVSYYTVCCTLCWHLTLAIQYFLTAYVTWTLLNVNGLNTLYAINPSMVSGSIQCKAFCNVFDCYKYQTYGMGNAIIWVNYDLFCLIRSRVRQCSQ